MSTLASATAKKNHRLAFGGLIDRSIPLSFRFDGREYRGVQGDTLASALIAAGVRLVGRSFKYHRPRGILTAGSEEPNAIVELRTGARREANTRATVVELFDGLEARSQNRWPSLAFDIGAVNSFLSPFLVAGFYYKTFMWPAAFWEKLYEPAIRRAAGLGRASAEADPDTYEKANAHCDVLIIGSGAAGLAAALAAGRAGARVILADEDFILGGRLNSERCEIDGISGWEWAQLAEAELLVMPEVRVMRRTTVFGVYDGCTYGALERVADHLAEPPPYLPRQRLWKIVAKRVVLAAGAIERPIVFGGNDRPGVMMASAVRTYLHRFAVTPGQLGVVFTTSDDGWKTAIDLAAAGVDVPAVVDARHEVRPNLVQAAERSGMRVVLGGHVVGTKGWGGIREVMVRDGRGEGIRLELDMLAVAGGWNPSLALSTHLGARPRWAVGIGAFVPGQTPRNMVVAGAANGSFSLADALRQGRMAGNEAADSIGFSAVRQGIPRTDDEPTDLSPLWQVTGSQGKAFVDFQHDVTDTDVALAVREGFRSVELLKRYTTLGMATDQGKTSGINGHAIMAALTGRGVHEVGTTVSRPPYTPVAIGALAGIHRGRNFRPTRCTASHDWAVEHNATFAEAGQWLRPQWFARPGEQDWLITVSREVRATRSAVGVCDVSTLGKIDIQGSDAASFLDRIYVNTFSTLAVGKARYGLMLREDGLAMDDGTTARFADGHFVMSTTTANAGGVMQHLEYARQVLWPELDVQIVSITEQWAQYSIAGPLARQLLECLLDGAVDVSNVAFPFMACAEFEWRGIPARLFRISFSGELAYELAVPARYGDATIRSIMQAGAEFGVTPYGTEALSVMRIEKGHIAGSELNGTTTARDLGLGRLVSTKKDFIGCVLSLRPGLVDAGRPALIGIRPVDRRSRLHAGAHFIECGARAEAKNDQGYVTSVAFSPVLEHWIGLGFLSFGPDRIGERMRAFDPVRGGDVEVEVCSPIFVDPKGACLRV